ncbi:unnamed protein product, partial [Ascophyllum nodosum]
SGPLRFAGFQYKDFKIPPNILLEESKRGGRKDNLEGFQRPQGEDVRRDRRLHTREAQAFAGTQALRKTRALRKSRVALLDTGSPASPIRKKFGTTCWEVAQHHQIAKRLRSPEDGADSPRNRQPPVQACN